MRKHLGWLVSVLGVVALAAPALAGTSQYGGTLRLDIGSLPTVTVVGTGVATLNGQVGGSHVYTITVGAGDIAGSDIAPVTDPDGIQDNGIISVRITATVGAGDLGRIGAVQHTTATSTTTSVPSPTIVTLTNADLGLSGGLARICVLLPACANNIPLALTHTAGTAGVGVGGQLVIPDPTLRVSVDAAPWTLLTATVIDQPDAGGAPGHAVGTTTFVTFNGGIGATGNFTLSRVFGYAHGPKSAVSTVALGTASGQFGVLQFVSPTQVTTNITSTSSLRIGTPTALTYRIVPEPGLLLLLGSGVAGLVLLGRQRMRK